MKKTSNHLARVAFFKLLLLYCKRHLSSEISTKRQNQIFSDYLHRFRLMLFPIKQDLFVSRTKETSNNSQHYWKNTKLILFSLVFRKQLAIWLLVMSMSGFASQPLYAQVCVSTDYNIVNNKQTIILSTTASTNGNINVIKDGNVSNNNFFYPNQSVGGKEYVRMQFPSPTILQGFEISVGAWLFANGTVMQVDGSNDGTNWTTLHTENETGSVTGCIYNGSLPCGNGAESYSFPSNTTAYTYYRLLGVSGNSRSTPWINELYFNVVPSEQSGLTNVGCNFNNTLFDGDDDYITFDLTPTGGSGNYTVSVAGATVTPSTGTFGATTSFRLPNGSAGGGNLMMTITGFTAGCQVVENIMDPGNCLPGACGDPDWNDPANKQMIILSSTAGISGSIDVLKDGNVNNNSFFYTGFSQSVAGKEYVRMQFPTPTTLKGFEIAVGAWLFANGMQ